MAKIFIAVLMLAFGALPVVAQDARKPAPVVKVRSEAKQPSPKYWMSRDLSRLFGMMQVKA